MLLFWWPDYDFDATLPVWQARAVSTDGLRPSFYTINAVVYVIQVKNLACDCTCYCYHSAQLVELLFEAMDVASCLFPFSFCISWLVQKLQ